MAEPLRTPAASSAAAEPIAVIGMSCRFSGAPDLQAFWRLLRDGVDAITEVPPDRWDVERFYDPDPTTPGAAVTRRGGFLEKLDLFDARFFEIAPREAAHVDPRQRLALELVWEALEDAGIPPERLAGSRTGVFIATLTGDYGELVFSDPARISAHTGPGGAHSVVANRVSYFFDLAGPSMTLDTACSGSLVAVHLACQSLASGESALALVGGVSVNLKPDANIFFSKAGALSPDGRCKTFDARADGMVRSDGAGILVLKRLAAALADGDPIHAVIRGSAVNSDGRSNGLMAPNERAQVAVLRDAYQRAAIPPGRVQYVEAHGTGTRLGDPIEVNALAEVLSADRAAGSLCALGSVKTNLGHMEAAAGVAGIVKIALSFRHRLLPPSLHFVEPNPLIPFGEIPLRVQAELGPWPRPDEPMIAGVSGFGVGGTNAHVVLEEPPAGMLSGALPEAHSAGEPFLVPISAHTPQALEALARAYLEMEPEPSLAEIACTASVRRMHHPRRLAIVAKSRADLAEQIAAFLRGERRTGPASSERQGRGRPRTVFVFSGQGSHWPGMGRGLWEREPVFRQALERVDAVLDPLLGQSLVARLLGAAADLEGTDVVQPAIFAIQVALAELWRSWGVQPDAFVGQSLGEVAACHVAGALRLEDACRVVHHRSRLMRRVAGRGRTALVELPFEQAQLVLTGFEDELAAAGSNSPQSTILSGESKALERIVGSLERRGIFCRMLQGVDVAFHSPQMDPLRRELVEALAGLAPAPVRSPLYSAVTAAAEPGTSFDAEYWGRNLREPFQFAAVVQQLLADGVEAFVEISPHPVLMQEISKGLRHAGREGTVVGSLRREQDERASLLASLAELYVAGITPDWTRIAPGPTRCVALPTYPWQRERHWYEEPQARKGAVGPRKDRGAHPLLGEPLVSASTPAQCFWEIDLSSSSLPYLEDHRVGGVVVLPGAAYLEIALAAAEQALGPALYTLEGVEFHQKLALGDESRRLQLVLTWRGAEEASFEVFSSPGPGTGRLDADWVPHASGRICRQPSPEIMPGAVSLEEAGRRCTEELTSAEHYEGMTLHGLDYGPAFRILLSVQRRRGEALGRWELARPLLPSLDRYRIHPVLLDSAFQLVSDAIVEKGFLPIGAESVRFYARAGHRGWCHAVTRERGRIDAGILTADIELLDETGGLSAEVRGLRLRYLESSAPVAQAAPGSWLYEVSWLPQERPERAPHPQRDGTWLIFADGGGVGRELANRLAGSGASCLLVTQGEGYERSAVDRTVRIDPASGEDYGRLLREALAGGGPPCVGIVHLWSLDAGSGEIDASSIERARGLGSEAVLHLVQALAGSPVETLPRLWLVTRGAQPAGDAATGSRIDQAPLWGLGRVVALEHPDLWGGLVDLDPRADLPAGELAASLYEEIGGSGQDQVALRAAGRYVARLARSTAPATQGGRFLPRADGAYLITGGLGGLGLRLARWLAERGARRLVLLGRSPLPPRREWSELPPDTEAARRVAAIRRIEALGTGVQTAAVDAADEAGLEEFLAEYRREGWPVIRGVVHAAGVLDDRLMIRMDPASLAAVLRPKVLGAWALHRLLPEALDFFVLFSSVSSVLGNLGQASYAAGNAFLDALAHYRHARGLPAMSINWGPWSEVGMAAQGSASGGMHLAIPSLSPEQGLTVFDLLLRRGVAQAVVIPADATDSVPSVSHAVQRVLLSSLMPAEPLGAGISMAASASHHRGLIRQELMAAGSDRRVELLRERLGGVVAGVLGLRPGTLDVWQPLTALGIDSIMATELKNRVDEGLGISIPIVAFFRGSSVAQLAAEALERIGAELSREAEASAPPVEEAPPVVPVPRSRDLPLSFSQQRHWFLHHLEPDSPLFNEAGGVALDGPLDVAALRTSLDSLVQRHEVLRTTFPTGPDGQPVQVISRELRLAIPVVDLSGLAAGRAERVARSWFEEMAHHPFDLDHGPLLRVLLARLDDRKHEVLIAMHHIISDGVSIAILNREIAEVYEALVSRRPIRLPPLAIQYADYALWQRRWLQGEVLASHLAYWRRQLAGAQPRLALPIDRPRPQRGDFRGASVPVFLDARSTAALRALSAQAGATLFTTLMAGFAALLHLCSEQDDITIGAPVANRDRPEIAGVLGCFINALPLRIDLSGDPSFRDLLARVRETVLGGLSHQDLPFEKLVEELNPERSRSHWPLFQVVLNFQSAWPEPPALPGLSARFLDLEGSRPSKYDLTLYLREEGETIVGSLVYRAVLFEPSTVTRMAEGLVRIFAQAAASQETHLSRFELHSEAERKQKIMERTEREKSNLQKLVSMRRKPVKVSAALTIETGYLAEGQTLPLVIKPTSPEVDLVSWAEANRDLVESELLMHGGILFRGFNVSTPETFERLSRVVAPELVNYVEGSSPRVMVTDRVYTSTEYPPEYFVSMHNELSYAHRWPSKLLFFCLVEPRDGGATPIADSRRVLAELPQSLRDKFVEKGVMYVRRLRGGKGAGLSWQTVFETDDASVVESYCREGGIELRWEEDRSLRTRQVRPAVIRHPRTGEPVWFNQADQFHPSNLGQEIAASLLATTGEEDLPINAYFGDGSPLDPSELDEVRAAFRRVMVVFPWRQGDVLLLDNMLVAHGRMPFNGPRKVVVAMGSPVSLSEVSLPKSAVELA